MRAFGSFPNAARRAYHFVRRRRVRDVASLRAVHRSLGGPGGSENCDRHERMHRDPDAPADERPVRPPTASGGAIEIAIISTMMMKMAMWKYSARSPMTRPLDRRAVGAAPVVGIGAEPASSVTDRSTSNPSITPSSEQPRRPSITRASLPERNATAFITCSEINSAGTPINGRYHAAGYGSNVQNPH